MLFLASRMRVMLWRASSRWVTSHRTDLRCTRLSRPGGNLLCLEAAVTQCSGAYSAPSPAATQRIALLVDSGAEINELLDRIFARENWSIQRVPDNCAALLTAAA